MLYIDIFAFNQFQENTYVVSDEQKNFLDNILIKINELEFQRSQQFIQSNIENKVICTLGSRGARYLNKVHPVREVKVFDTTGAGDAFFAGFLIKYFEIQDIFKAIEFGNSCASISVTQRGTGIIR